ncbi:hypothetical protein, partial [Streptosporangium amethystogenes]|uniref:hypothetical protein n=1 Tax=Streptosporangium amethystogenes TaxID=2002 RepID=UPI001B80A44A
PRDLHVRSRRQRQMCIRDRSRPPRPARSSAPPLLRQRLVLDRYAERRKGTDRRLVLLVMFTGVISVTAVAALNHRGRG